MTDSIEFPALELPQIRPISNNTAFTDRSPSFKHETKSYDQWRATIHRELEEDLQRQVRQIVEESERQERLAKLRRQYLRAGRQQSTDNNNNQCSTDPYGEIDRRNQRILYPLNAKDSYGKLAHHSSLNYSKTKLSGESFHLESYQNLSQRRNLSQRTNDEHLLFNPTNYLKKFQDKQTHLSTNNQFNPTFLLGNSIIKSNKEDILTRLEQQSTLGGCSTVFTNKHGVIIDEDGPFWPRDFRILYPTPKLLTRELSPKELYLTNVNSSLLSVQSQQTFDNQPAMRKYTDVVKHPILIYDMDKSPRQQQAKPFDSEQMCPSLMFESRFEGGNLRQVKRVGQFEYELILRPDLYTKRHTQWYYFRVQNMIANITYRFRIINLMKKSSLYNEGMQILMFSDVAGKRDSRGWHRAGHHINYSESKQRNFNPLLERDINYFELDFQLEFVHSGDTCYIAHCYPYTFTDLKDDLDYLSSIRSKEIFRREILCESQAGNSCFMITVTDESVPINKKKFVFITARIHPGETNSSYMMRGLLEFITSDDKIARILRSQLIFKIIPMLNPDGVIIGNYRCSLTGKDMNRNFRHPRKQTFPTIYHIKELMQNLQKEQHEIIAFCDLHGHSRKSNVFAYGCDGCDGSEADMKNFLNARILPYIMSRTAPEMFAFDYCKFHIHRCKESTGRVVMWKEMLIKNSFTLEASFAGSSIVEKPCHFNIQDYERFGQCICQSLRQYLDVLSDSSRLDSIFMDITKNVLRKLGKEKIPAAILPSLYPEEKSAEESVVPITSVANCIQVLTQCHTEINEQDAPSSSDSDSDPEGGELPDLAYSKEDLAAKKKSKKKRTDKPTEERLNKSIRKREVNNPSQPIRTTINSTNDETHIRTHITIPDIQHRMPVSQSLTTDVENNSSLKLTLAVDQIDKANRAPPSRGTLFTSKYANRSGHGLPIFTTERALERRQKRSNSVLQDVPLDRHLNDDYDADAEQAIFSIPERPHLETAPTADQLPSSPVQVKRTASFVCLNLPDLPAAPTNDQSVSTISGAFVTPSSIFKTLPQRRLQRHAHRPKQQQQVKPFNGFENDHIPAISPPILNVPNLIELATRATTLPNLTSSISNFDTYTSDSSTKFSYETQIDSNGINHHRLQPPNDHLLTQTARNTPNISLKMPAVNTGNQKKISAQRPVHYIGQQPLSSIETILRERSVIIGNENTPQPDAMERVNHILKQLYLPTPEKTKRT